MSESEKKVRTVPEIQNEYQGLCLRAGHLNYQIYALSKDLDMVQNSLRDLNIEAATAQAAEKAAAATPAEGATSAQA